MHANCQVHILVVRAVSGEIAAEILEVFHHRHVITIAPRTASVTRR